MRLTEQQRAELERHGFVVLDGDVLADPASGRVFSIDGALPRAAEAAAILGIAPPSYRLVQEEVAEKAVPLIEELLQHMARSRVSLNDVEADLSKAERKHIWTALASALQGKEVEKR